MHDGQASEVISALSAIARELIALNAKLDDLPRQLFNEDGQLPVKVHGNITPYTVEGD